MSSESKMRWIQILIPVAAYVVTGVIVVTVLRADVSRAHERLDGGDKVDAKHTEMIERLDRLSAQAEVRIDNNAREIERLRNRSTP